MNHFRVAGDGVMIRMLSILGGFLILAIINRMATAGETSSVAPNIIVMLVDDMGVMDTSVPFLTDKDKNPKRYPLNEFYRTPNMERLASLGVRFNNFCAMSVCSPTRVSIMTGQNSARHRTTNWINPDTNNAGPNGPRDWNWKGLGSHDITLPRLLQANGYRTMHVGKGHFAPRGSEGANPQSIGFDTNVAGASIGAPGSYFGRQDFDSKNKKNQRSDHAVPGLDQYHGQDIFLTEALTLEAKLQISDAAKNGTPFFLYFPQYAVHSPFNSDDRFAAHYSSSEKPAAAQAFATLIEGMDKSLGDILDHLATIGVADNTLVLFLGDNGSDAPLGHQHEVASAAPLRGRKGSHYEGGMRVPFIAAWAQTDEKNINQQKLPIAINAIQSQQAAVYDLFPTILGLTGIDIPSGHTIDGRSLNTLLTAVPDASRSETFLMHYPHAPHRTDYFTVYRDDDWKVIYHYFPSPISEGSHYQLFNLRNDPFEQVNLAPTHPAEVRRLMEKLVQGLESQQALYPVDDSSMPMQPIVPITEPNPQLAIP